MDFNDKAFGSLMAALGGLFIFLVVLVIAVLVFQIIVMVKVYKKAGKGGWEAIIPYYSTWVQCEIAGLKWWFFLIASAYSICTILGLAALLPLAGLVAIAGSFFINYNIAIKFEKDPIGFGIGLTLLPVIFYAILAFGPAKYTDAKVSSYGPIPEEKIEKK